jgi:DNA-binding SARP family transcriptional activator/tetratricopeptide (TPR) repeat protein
VEISFRILGPPEIVAAERSRVALAPRYWRVLASMLLRPNMPVPTSALAAEVWGEDPAAQAHGTVRSYISKIGKVLSQAAGSEVRIARQEHGYVLSVDPQAVDLHRFRALRRQAAAVADSGDHQHAALLLREANALWRGPALAGLSGDWITRMRDSLEEERRAASVQCIEAELHLGRHAELLGDLHLLSEQYPFDEKIIEYQMTALYRSSRQADALRVYRESRARLTEEGLQPGHGLAEHHQRILRHDPGLAITPAYRRPGHARQPDTLPPGLGDFIGRDEEVQLLTSEIGHRPGPLLQVIDGMAGAGKTSLAVHVARHVAGRFPDAALYIDFNAHGPGQPDLSAADALHRLLRMLDVPAERIPATMTGRSTLWRSELAHRRALIVLDDVTGPEKILPIVPAAGDCLIIVTSRRRHADWAGTRPKTLDVLPDEDAITMFTRVAGPDTATDVSEVARAVRLCGCLPLAIRVTASRLRDGRATGLSNLLDELSDVQADCDPAGEVSERVLSAFEFSYRGLTAAQRRFFRYLGISPCPDTPAYAAMALTGGTLADTVATLGALQGHHLLRQSSPGRFQFHDLVHAFAMARFRQEDTEAERHRAAGRLLDYYLHTAEHASRLLYAAPRQTDLPSHPAFPEPAMTTPHAARAWLESEWSNILHVAQYAARRERKSHCADLTHTIAEFLDTSGYWHHAASAHMIALQACQDLDDLPRAAQAAFDLSLTNLRIGKHEAALQQARYAAVIYRTLGDRQGHAAAVDRIGVIHRYSARFRDALAHHQEAMDIHRQIGDEHGVARDVGNVGIAYTSLGEYSRAIDYLNQALDIYRRASDRRGEARTLMNICAAQGDQGYHRDALSNCQESLSVFREIGGHRQQISLLLHNMGEIYRYKGEYRKALTEYREALAGYREIGDLQYQSQILCDIGAAYQGLECYSEALVHHEKAEPMASEIGNRYGRVKALCGMADAHRAVGSYADALAHYEQARRLAREIEAPYQEAKALYGTAETLLRTQGVEAARIYWREACEIFGRLGAPEAAILEIRLDPLTASAS